MRETKTQKEPEKVFAFLFAFCWFIHKIVSRIAWQFSVKYTLDIFMCVYNNNLLFLLRNIIYTRG